MKKIIYIFGLVFAQLNLLSMHPVSPHSINQNPIKSMNYSQKALIDKYGYPERFNNHALIKTINLFLYELHEKIFSNPNNEINLEYKLQNIRDQLDDYDPFKPIIIYQIIDSKNLRNHFVHKTPYQYAQELGLKEIVTIFDEYKKNLQ